MKFLMACIVAAGLCCASTAPAAAWHPWKTQEVPIEKPVVKKEVKPKRVVEIRPTRDPVVKRKPVSIWQQIGRSAFVSLTVGAIVTTARVGACIMGICGF